MISSLNAIKVSDLKTYRLKTPDLVHWFAAAEEKAARNEMLETLAGLSKGGAEPKVAHSRKHRAERHRNSSVFVGTVYQQTIRLGTIKSLVSTSKQSGSNVGCRGLVGSYRWCAGFAESVADAADGLDQVSVDPKFLPQ